MSKQSNRSIEDNGAQDFGTTLSLYAEHSMEALLRRYFQDDKSGERVKQLRQQMIAQAVCGQFSFTLDLRLLLEKLDTNYSRNELHPLTVQTFEDNEKFVQLASYLCDELLGAKNDTLCLKRPEDSLSGASKLLVRFEWKPTLRELGGAQTSNSVSVKNTIARSKPIQTKSSFIDPFKTTEKEDFLDILDPARHVKPIEQTQTQHNYKDSIAFF